jgi:hypothetical protein
MPAARAKVATAIRQRLQVQRVIVHLAAPGAVDCTIAGGAGGHCRFGGAERGQLHKRGACKRRLACCRQVFGNSETIDQDKVGDHDRCESKDSCCQARLTRSANPNRKSSQSVEQIELLRLGLARTLQVRKAL